MTARPELAPLHRRLARRPSALAPALVLPALLALLPLPAGAADPVYGKLEGGKFTPGRPPAARFGAEADVTCPRSTLAVRVQDAADDLARSAKRDPPQPDGRLCQVAEAFLGWDAKEPPSESVVAFVGQYFGLPVPPQRPAIVTIDTDEASVLAEKLLEPLGTFALNARTPRYGFATRRLRTIPSSERGRFIGQMRVALVLLDGSLGLDPVPRRLAPGEKARLSGKLLGGIANPRITWSDPAGGLTTPSLPAGTSFQAELSCGDRPGLIRVEIRGEHEGSPITLGRFPIACGTELATSVPVAGPAPWPTDPAEQERRMLEGVNAERQGAGLPPLGWDDALAGVAREVAEVTRDAVRKGTFDAPSDVLARLKKVGIATAVVVQNPGLAGSAEAAFQQLSSSPAHRANMLNKDVNRAGIGVVDGTTPDGRAVVIVDQLFIKDVPAQDLDSVRKQLGEAVTEKRKVSRNPPVTTDPELEAVAQRFAQEMATTSGELPKARRDEILASLGKGWKIIHMTPPGAKADPLDFAEESEVTGAGKFVGVGVAKGMHPTLGRNALYVTILVGSRR